MHRLVQSVELMPQFRSLLCEDEFGVGQVVVNLKQARVGHVRDNAYTGGALDKSNKATSECSLTTLSGSRRAAGDSVQTRVVVAGGESGRVLDHKSL